MHLKKYHRLILFPYHSLVSILRENITFFVLNYAKLLRCPDNFEECLQLIQVNTKTKIPKKNNALNILYYCKLL